MPFWKENVCDQKNYKKCHLLSFSNLFLDKKDLQKSKTSV